MSKCKLCQKEKTLLKRSHIIPDFMYKGLYDDKNKLYFFAPAKLVKGERRIDRPSSGEYEANILCKECDNEIIGKYESYASKALYGKSETSTGLPECAHFKTSGGIKFTRCKNFQYKEFKLFLLSILWKASISTRPFFKEIYLGAEEEMVRQMLETNDPKGFEVFPILMMTWLADKKFPNDLVAQPGYNNNRYIFPISGITYVIHKTISDLPKEYKEFCLLPTNEVSLLHIPEGKSMELLLSYSGV